MIYLKQYKKSAYNIFVPFKNDETIVFNGLTGAIGKFDAATMKHYEMNTLSDEEIDVLVKKGILIPIDYNEIEKINSDRKIGINNEKTKHFRIWTTSGCNAQCYYCFENGVKNITMSTNTASALVGFIEKLLECGDRLEIEWFGGEPLLNTKIIDFISEHLIKICTEKKCTYQSAMISNGSLISRDIVEKMKSKWKLSAIQITLDGYDEYYDKAKRYFNPKLYNFWNVISNIKLLAENDIFVSIRMNYDTSNFISLKKLIEFLHSELSGYEKVGYYIYPLWDALNEDDPNAFRTKTLADNNLIKLFDMLVNYNMNTIINVARLKYRKHQCKSCNKYSYAILADGKIVKCCETFKQILGDVWNGISDREHYDFWTSNELDDKCKTCVYLPICQGGCKSSHFTKMPQCFAYKPIINDILRWYVSKLDSELARK